MEARNAADDPNEARSYRPRVDARRGQYYTNRRLSSLLPGRQSDILGLSFEQALGLGHRHAVCGPSSTAACRARPACWNSRR